MSKKKKEPVFETTEIFGNPYKDSVVYSFGILIDGKPVLEDTPVNPQDPENLDPEWVGVYEPKVFRCQVQNGCCADTAVSKFVQAFKAEHANQGKTYSLKKVKI